MSNSANEPVSVSTTSENSVETTTVNNNSSEESQGDLNAKISEMQPLLEKIAELKETYKNSPNAKKNEMKQEFETTKEKLITLQTEINELISDLALETNAISFLKEKYPNYISSLENLKVLERINSSNSVEEEMGAGMSNNNATNANTNNQNANANTIANNSNRNSNANSAVNLNSNKNNSRVSSLNNNKNSNSNSNSNSNTVKNKKANNTTPVNSPTPMAPANNTRRNLSGGKRRKNKSRKINRRR